MISNSLDGKASAGPVLWNQIHPEPKKVSNQSLKSDIPLLATNSLNLPPELSPVGPGYELSFAAKNIVQQFNVAINSPVASNSTGLGIFKFDSENGWSFVSNEVKDGKFVGVNSKPGLIALLRDNLAPRISLSTKIDPSEPFKTARPKFVGSIEEFGSGLELGSLVASVDEVEQPISVLEAGGKFKFVPIEPLTGGEHTLQIRALDRVGNLGKTAEIVFAIQVPLSIGEISVYPNPARSKATFRVSTNRSDINDDHFEIKIYDVAGHIVRYLDGIQPVREATGFTARFLFDIPWDLKNEDGKTVANGVYIAKFTLFDPDDASKKVKKNHKLAVLR